MIIAKLYINKKAVKKLKTRKTLLKTRKKIIGDLT